MFGYLADTFVFKKLDKKVSKALRQLKLIPINTHYKVII